MEGEQKRKRPIQMKRKERKGIKKETMKLKQNMQKLNGYYVQKIGEALLQHMYHNSITYL